MSNDLSLWTPGVAPEIPATADTPELIVKYAKQLSQREVAQVVDAFRNRSYEMGALFLWQKTMAGLKKQIGSLGTEFVAELLDREDIAPGTTPVQFLSDFDAVRLGEELGMFTPTQALRLRNVLQLVVHFSESPAEGEEHGDRQMMPEEALSCLRTCVQGVLGYERLEGAIEFARFRRELEERSYTLLDEDIQKVLHSPYFFQRTTVRVLLALIKRSNGAQLQHVLSNTNVILPAMWGSLAKPDRWMVGRAYAEVHSEGRRTAASGLKKALLQVRGFDYVPEDLRSRTFISAAKELQSVHFAVNNYYNEPAAVRSLVSLGTAIPTPALSACMTALLCVRLGNHWGISWDAQEPAQQMLSSLPADRWVYYLDECLPTDDIILDKLCDSSTLDRWIELVQTLPMDPKTISHKEVGKLLKSSLERKAKQASVFAQGMRNKTREN